MDELVCAVWSGDTSMHEAARVEAFRRLNWKLDEFLEEAAVAKGFWEGAKFQANQGGKDFVQQAIGVSRGLPEAEAWQACEPLEEAILAFVQRAAAGGYEGLNAEVAGNLGLLVTVVEDHMQQVHAWQESLQAAKAGCSGGG